MDSGTDPNRASCACSSVSVVTDAALGDRMRRPPARRPPTDRAGVTGAPRLSRPTRSRRPPLRRHVALVGLVAGVGRHRGRGRRRVMLAVIRRRHRPRADGEAHHGVAAADAIPLSEPQIVGLLVRSPDYGPLGDPHRRASCLTGWAIRRRRRCSARGRSRCTAARGAVCCPATRPGRSWRWSSSRTAAQPTPACWPTRWSPVRNLSCTPREHPGLRWCLTSVPT